MFAINVVLTYTTAHIDTPVELEYIQTADVVLWFAYRLLMCFFGSCRFVVIGVLGLLAWLDCRCGSLEFIHNINRYVGSAI